MSSYRELERRFRRLNDLQGAVAVLEWDRAAMMPAGGAEARAEQIATLELLAHEILTDPRLGGLLDEAEDEAAALGAWERANLGEMRRRWVHATALDADLVAALTRATAACEMRWREARAANDFAGLVPLLGEVVRLVREQAAAKAEKLGCGPYDALLDHYEPGMTTGKLDVLFGGLAAFLPGFLSEAIERQAARGLPSPLRGPFAVAKQRELGLRLMGAVGFDFAHGRLDVSHHPFCGGVPEDIRITTRYDEADFTKSLMGVLHETGHALYERHLPAEWRHQPVGQARSTAMHESQSLLIEMQACRSPEFLSFAAPIIRETFEGDGPAWEADNLYRLYTRVERGLIRVDADEVTYPAHITLRYRLERALVGGNLEVGDLPGAWNEGMRALLGVAPPDDRDGCLQDIHWMVGAFGYFPCYTLGAIAAAQLFAAAKEANPDIPEALARGDFAPLRAWLTANVHALGCLLPADELLARATGRPLALDAFKAHLEARYLA